MRRVGKKEKQDPNIALGEHVAALKLRSIGEYQVWCRTNGFSTFLNKHRKERARETAFNKQTAQNKTRSVFTLRPKPRETIDWIVDACNGCDLTNIAIPHLREFALLLQNKASINQSQLERERICTDSLGGLVNHIASTKAKFLFEPLAAHSCLPNSSANTFLTGLALLCAYRKDWLRDPTDWKPLSYNPRRQFRSLVQHLLDKHGEIPGCLFSAWFRINTPEFRNHRRWCVQVGAGHGLRHCDLPIPYSKMLARCFKQAPENLFAEEALRWAHVVSSGGPAKLAAQVVASRLGRTFANHEFWDTVIHWLIEHPMLDTIHIGPIVDYLQEQRFVPALQDQKDAKVSDAKPLQPNLSMKGRTPENIRNAISRWHGRLGELQSETKQIWEPSGIQPFLLREGLPNEGNEKVWSIRELLSHKSLMFEGRKLKHCVSSYASSCRQGRSSIWSLELETGGQVEKRITIEVCPFSRQIATKNVATNIS